MVKLSAADLDRIPRVSAGLDCEICVDEVLVHNSFAKLTTLLNASASLVLSLCDGKRSIREIICAIELQYPNLHDEITADVSTTIRRFIEDGIVRL
jgi:hypothetical protein